MPGTVSVVIPTRDEAAWIAASVASALAAGALEVIVADGGSADGTAALAAAAGATVVTGERVRARQLNRGASVAIGDVLLFLHADTLLPRGACAEAAAALERGAAFGGFLLEFVEPRRVLRAAAALVNARTRLTREPWGDQAQFLSRTRFLASGGYREMPLMEDYEMARRWRRREVAILPLRVRTSGRRFLARGVAATVATNWAVVAAYHLGVPPGRLAQWYRGRRREQEGRAGR